MRRKKQKEGVENPHDPVYVANLFDRMASTYGVLNYITSFGFSERWRKQCVEAANGVGPVESARPSVTHQGRGTGEVKRSEKPTGQSGWPQNAIVYDLMCGMGETWPSLFRYSVRQLVALDLSEAMCAKANSRKELYPGAISVLRQDVLSGNLPAGIADVVICSFGLKTLSDLQRKELAVTVRNLLKPGGRFSFVEISDPQGWFLRRPYMFYLKRVIPVLGRLFGGDPVAYGMLGFYTETFGDCSSFALELENAGLHVEYRKYFSGCATGVFGGKKTET